MGSVGAYTLLSSAELMENHIPAAVLDANGEFFAARTAAGASILLSIGSDSVFRSAVSSDGGQTGWTTLDISPLVAAQFADPSDVSAKMFSATLNQGTGILTLLLAVTDASGSAPVDTLYAISGPAGVDPSLWLVDASQIVLTAVGYDGGSKTTDATLPYTIDKASLRITGVYAEAGLTASDPMLLVASVVDTAVATEVWCFTITPGASPAWGYYPQEQNLGVTPPAQIVTGCGLSDQLSGIYKLYTLGGQQSLSFKPSAGVFGGPANAVIYQTPAGATAIAALDYVDQDGTVSDLFVAGAGSLYWFPYGSSEHQQGQVVVSSPTIAGVTQLHAVNAVDRVLVWGVNGAGQVFYTAVDFASRGDASAWQTPLPLLTGTIACAPVQGLPSSAADLFAFGSIPASLTASQSAQGLLRLTRKPTTHQWQTALVAAPSTADTITLRSYTTRVLLTTDGGVPAVNATLSVSPTSDCALILNGVSTLVSAGTTFTVVTDTAGNANIIHSISDLAAVPFTFTMPDQSTAKVNPGAAVEAKMQSISQASDLTSQTYVAADGTTQNLVQNPSAAGGAATAIHTLANASVSLPRAKDLAVRATRATLPPLQDGESFFDELGDLVQYVVNVVEEVADIAIQPLAKGFKILITVGEDLLSAVVQTVEDVYAAITAVLKWIGAALDAAFRWLAFLFDWSTFVAVGKVFEATASGILTNFASGAAGIQKSVDTLLANAIANIQNSSAAVQSMPAASGQSTFTSRQPSSYSAGQADTRTDPKLGWTKDRVGSIGGAGGGATAVRARLTAATSLSPPRLDGDSPFVSLSQTVDQLVADFENAVSELESDVSEFAKGNIDAQTFFAKLLAALEVLGLSSAQALFDGVMGSLEQLVADLNAVLDTPITIPVLSPLFKAATGQELTILNLIGLLAGIMFSIIYKIATDSDPLAALQNAGVSSALPAVMGSITGYLSGTGAVSAPQHATATADEGGTDTTDWVVAVSLMLRSITVFAIGAIEIVEANAGDDDDDEEDGAEEGPVNTVYFFDLFLRMLALGGELSNMDADDDMQPVAAMEMVVVSALAFFTLADLTQNKSGDSIGGGLRKIDGLAAFATSIWAIVELSKNCPSDPSPEIMSIGVEITDVPQMILLYYLSKSPGNIDLSAVTGGLVGLRTIATLGAGLMALDND